MSRRDLVCFSGIAVRTTGNSGKRMCLLLDFIAVLSLSFSLNMYVTALIKVRDCSVVVGAFRELIEELCRF